MTIEEHIKRTAGFEPSGNTLGKYLSTKKYRPEKIHHGFFNDVDYPATRGWFWFAMAIEIFAVTVIAYSAWKSRNMTIWLVVSVVAAVLVAADISLVRLRHRNVGLLSVCDS